MALKQGCAITGMQGGRAAVALVAVGVAAVLGSCVGTDDPKVSGVAPEWLRPFIGPVTERYDAADVKFRYLSDGELAQEVRSGRKGDVVIAPTDVLPSSDAYPGRYEQVKSMGSDQLVMVVAKGQTKVLSDSFDVADDPGVRLATARGGTELGRLTTSGVASLKSKVQRGLQANIKRRERSGDGVLRAVRDGSVDAGLALDSDVNRHPTGIKIIFLPDESLAQAQSWQAGVRTNTQERDAAHAFVESMFDGKAARQLRSLGLSQGPGQPAEETVPAG